MTIVWVLDAGDKCHRFAACGKLLLLSDNGQKAYDARMERNQRNTAKLTIEELHPSYTEAELRQAEQDWLEYLQLLLRIYKRIIADPAQYARFKALTADLKSATIKAQPDIKF